MDDGLPERYSQRPLPPYAYIPGQTPRPSRKPVERLSAECDGQSPPFPDQWADSDEYRYGIDLLNFGFWWESHEVFEVLWREVGPKSVEGNFFQALIQLAAAQVKHRMGNDVAAARLARKVIDRLTDSPPIYMGLDVIGLRQTIESHGLGGRRGIRIQLRLPNSGQEHQPRHGTAS